MRTRSLVALVLVACGGSPAPRSAEVVPPPPAAEAAAAPCVAAELAGSWDSGEAADFESITLDADGTFMSYLHDRPFYVGAWTLADGTLELRAEGGTIITVADARCQGASLTGSSDGAPVRWTAIR